MAYRVNGGGALYGAYAADVNLQRVILINACKLDQRYRRHQRPGV